MREDAEIMNAGNGYVKVEYPGSGMLQAVYDNYHLIITEGLCRGIQISVRNFMHGLVKKILKVYVCNLSQVGKI
jgi:hypothetical protein